ncbi:MULTISPECIES: hypothetical protein [Methylobacterium]|uniref:hypothetical protein n=1 Tax=Methylobacterium TaxID=407 RepID=UPI0013EA9C4B|nr:hypothetical protein [Methylobacterium sp. DB0501]NGM38759.1 hypothetical protein [Methylobacterium sp. DB0501]
MIPKRVSPPSSDVRLPASQCGSRLRSSAAPAGDTKSGRDLSEFVSLGRLQAAWKRTVLVALLLLATVTPLSAQIGMEIGDPVPSDLRERVADLLRAMRPHDSDAAIAAARIIDGDLWRRYGLLLLRIEADCRATLCMTVLSRVGQADLTPQLTLNADKQVHLTDAGVDLWGALDFPIHIKGHGSTGIIATPRLGSWVVEACGGCFPSGEELARRPAVPPSPPSPSLTFEEFRRSLDLDP